MGSAWRLLETRDIFDRSKNAKIALHPNIGVWEMNSISFGNWPSYFRKRKLRQRNINECAKRYRQPPPIGLVKIHGNVRDNSCIM
jgi:hypothetical protein